MAHNCWKNQFKQGSSSHRSHSTLKHPYQKWGDIHFLPKSLLKQPYDDTYICRPLDFMTVCRLMNYLQNPDNHEYSIPERGLWKLNVYKELQ